MRIEPFICLAGVELANNARTSTYIANIGLPGATMPTECACYAYDDGYDTPLSDPAPWYDPTRPESADFFGFYASNATLDAVYTRAANQSARLGGVLGPIRPKARTVLVEGMMLARTAEGMAYGERWVAEVLRGSPCNEGGCATDDILFLPACPEAEYDADRYFRTLMLSGVIDGPVYAPIQALPECLVQQANFSLMASMPYIYHPADRCINNELIASYYGVPLSCSLTTPQWMGDGTFVIDITAQADIDHLEVIGRISLDGTCPVSGLGTSVPPTFSYTIESMANEDRLVIDGARRQVLYYDASTKTASSALPRITWEGPFPWPDVGPCTTMCLTLEARTGEAFATVDTYLREF